LPLRKRGHFPVEAGQAMTHPNLAGPVDPDKPEEPESPIEPEDEDEDPVGEPSENDRRPGHHGAKALSSSGSAASSVRRY